MIIDLLVSAVMAVVGPLFDALPVNSIGILDPDQYTGIADQLGRWIAKWDGIIPVVFMVESAALAIAITLPATLVYKVLNWVWKHIPNIAGFGPGSG